MIRETFFNGISLRDVYMKNQFSKINAAISASDPEHLALPQAFKDSAKFVGKLIRVLFGNVDPQKLKDVDTFAGVEYQWIKNKEKSLKKLKLPMLIKGREKTMKIVDAAFLKYNEMVDAVSGQILQLPISDQRNGVKVCVSHLVKIMGSNF
jgi:hypothetical protein